MNPQHRNTYQSLSRVEQPGNQQLESQQLESQQFSREQMHYRFHGATPELPHRSAWSDRQPHRAQRRALRGTEPMVHVLLTLAHLEPEALETLDRGERYRRSLDHATAQRQCIERWLAEEQLLDEVMRLGDPNTFNLLFVSCTPCVAERLHEAPGVIDVAMAQPGPPLR